MSGNIIFNYISIRKLVWCLFAIRGSLNGSKARVSCFSVVNPNQLVILDAIILDVTVMKFQLNVWKRVGGTLPIDIHYISW